MISIAIDAKEKRAVATADIEGAYLHVNMDEVVIMNFEEDMVDYSMVQANPEKYGPCVHTMRNGKKLLYVELLKALYGCIKSALAAVVQAVHVNTGGDGTHFKPIRLVHRKQNDKWRTVYNLLVCGRPQSIPRATIRRGQHHCHYQRKIRKDGSHSRKQAQVRWDGHRIYRRRRSKNSHDRLD